MTRSGLAPALVGAAAGLGVLLGGAGAADAASFGTLQNGGSESELVNFNQFNPALGTLNAVDVTLTSTVGGGSTFSITGAEGDASGSTGFSASLRVYDPNNNQLFSGSFNGFASCTPGGSPFSGGQSCSDGPNPTSPGTFNGGPVGPGDTNPFIGAGLVALLASIDSFNVDPVDCNLPSFQGSCDPQNSITWVGDLTVTYFYRDQAGGKASINALDVPGAVGAIPEPASLALLGFGLAGLGWARRRRA